MCDPYQSSPNPDVRLARLIERETGVKIDRHLLRMFIRANWVDVARLAHLIHGSTKPQRGTVDYDV